MNTRKRCQICRRWLYLGKNNRMWETHREEIETWLIEDRNTAIPGNTNCWCDEKDRLVVHVERCYVMKWFILDTAVVGYLLRIWYEWQSKIHPRKKEVSRKGKASDVNCRMVSFIAVSWQYDTLIADMRSTDSMPRWIFIWSAFSDWQDRRDAQRCLQSKSYQGLNDFFALPHLSTFATSSLFTYDTGLPPETPKISTWVRRCYWDSMECLNLKIPVNSP